MLVFKFGGASVKNSEAVRNVVTVIQKFKDEKIIVVVSAMGKTTNAFEDLANNYWKDNEKAYFEVLEERRAFHYEIINELFDNKKHPVFDEVEHIFNQLQQKFKKPLSDNYDFEYDQIVSLGEVLSTKIIAAFLQKEKVNAVWFDARQLIRTNHNYREGRVNWEKSTSLLQTKLLPKLNSVECNIAVTQGFIGHTPEGFTTTLGREGSDFSAGILAFSLDAESVTIWKDVPGMLNADPKWFEDTVKLNQISYREAIELAYFGASVIHPKTIKPLQNKNIPLYVKSFINPEDSGTVIHQDAAYDADVASFIFKMNQVLISISPKDFSFIEEENLSEIFAVLAQENIKVNLMQNSAISFSIATDQINNVTEKLQSYLGEKYQVRFNQNLELLTIRHYDEKTIERITKGKQVLLEQRTRQTMRMILKLED